VNVWDLAAQWSARRWLRRLDARLQGGRLAAEHDPALAVALSRHVQVVKAQVAAAAAARAGFVAAPPLVLLAVYAEEIHTEAVKAGWRPPLVWTALDGLSLRLLACCQLVNHRNELVRH
jgi:hypothetical protein